MEEQYRDYFGNPTTKKKYKEQMDYRKKAIKKREEKEKERLQKKLHDDGPSGGQKLKNALKRSETKKAYDKSGKVFKYKKDPYAGKVKEPNITNKKYSQPRSSDYDEMSMEQLMNELAKQTAKAKKRKKNETKLFGRPKKKGELGI